MQLRSTETATTSLKLPLSYSQKPAMTLPVWLRFVRLPG
jgi:hypothetical protein